MELIPFKCAYCGGNGEYKVPTFEENSKYSKAVTKKDLEFVKGEYENRAKNDKNNICSTCNLKREASNAKR